MCVCVCGGGREAKVLLGGLEGQGKEVGHCSVSCRISVRTFMMPVTKRKSVSHGHLSLRFIRLGVRLAGVPSVSWHFWEPERRGGLGLPQQKTQLQHRKMPHSTQHAWNSIREA